MRIGFHASHEQFAPSDLLTWAGQAQAAGFDAGMCSDHFSPFSEAQGHSGFAWSWLGAALQSTQLTFGTVSAPGYRYHPAILAQAASTLAEMFPERFWLALGSGEYLNERLTGEPWPPLEERRARLSACADIVRRLFAGETVTCDGPVKVCEAKLYTRAAIPPRIFAAAVSPESAARVAAWADGLITVNQAPETLQRVVRAFVDNGGEGKPMYLQVHVAWAPTESEALANAHSEWRSNVFAGPLLWDAPRASDLDAAARYVRPDDLRDSVRISADLGQHLAWIEEDQRLGFDAVYLHEVGRAQQRFIDAFGTSVLPRLR